MDDAAGVRGPEQHKLGGQTLWNRDFLFIALINLLTFLGFNMTTTGLPVYAASLDASAVAVGLVTTLTTAATLIIRPFSGLALDRFGRKGMLIAGLATTALIIAAYPLFPILGVLLAIRFCHGVAWALTSTATSTLAADLIPRQRFAEGMGYFALAAACWQRTPPIRATQPSRLSLGQLFEKRALLPAALAGLINCAFGAVVTFVALHGAARGVTDIWLYFVVYALVTMATRPIVGRIIDRRGFFGPGLFAAGSVAATLALLSLADNIFLFCLAGAFAGLGIGTGQGTLQTMAVATVSPARRGVATATYFFGFDAGIGLGAAAAGAIAGSTGYGPMFLAMTAFPLAAFLIILCLGSRRIRAYSQPAEEL